MVAVLQCGARQLDLSRPVVMGVLNVTPDSFSDGGHFVELDSAIRQAEQMLCEGAAIIDVGGESTRPGASSPGLDEELDRVIPVLEALSSRLDVTLSIDTSTPEVMHAAVAAGAGMINDVRALQRPGALHAAVGAAVPVCLMHMQGSPRTMQENPSYADVSAEILGFLQARVDAAVAAGIRADAILLDPGFGFGKTLEHNLSLLRELERFQVLGKPLLVGFSRKSMIGQVLARPPTERLAGSLALAVMAVERGARIIRAHDVAATVDAVKMVEAVMGSTDRKTGEEH